jgi:hypothetical protein
LQTTSEFMNSRGITKCYAPSFFIPIVLVPAFRPCRQEAFCLLPGMLEILMFSGRTRTPTGSFGGSSVGKDVLLYDPTAASFQLEMKLCVAPTATVSMCGAHSIVGFVERTHKHARTFSRLSTRTKRHHAKTVEAAECFRQSNSCAHMCT